MQRLTDALNNGTTDLIPRRLRINNAPGFMDSDVFDNPGRAQARIHFHFHKVRPKTLAHGAIRHRFGGRRGDEDVVARRHPARRNLLLQVFHRFDDGHTGHDRGATPRLAHRVRAALGITGDDRDL